MNAAAITAAAHALADQHNRTNPLPEHVIRLTQKLARNAGQRAAQQKEIAYDSSTQPRQGRRPQRHRTQRQATQPLVPQEATAAVGTRSPSRQGRSPQHEAGRLMNIVTPPNPKRPTTKPNPRPTPRPPIREGR